MTARHPLADLFRQCQRGLCLPALAQGLDAQHARVLRVGQVFRASGFVFQLKQAGDL